MDLIIYTLRSIGNAILFPPLVFILLIMLGVFYFKNRKRAVMQKMMVGADVESAIELTLSQFVFGVLGGIIGSVILNLLGVVFNENCRIEILFLTSMILMAIKPSLVCFSYSAAVLGIISIIFKIISNVVPDSNFSYILSIDILHIMMFVGVMHIVEGILVFLDGHRGAFPILIRKEDEILGGYSLRRYWILPVAIMIIGNLSNSYNTYESIILSDIPSYWVLFKPDSEIELLKVLALSMFSFYAVIGYSSVTYTKTKVEKARSSGLHIFSYGIVLLAVAQLSRLGIAGEIFVVIFAPVAHEFMLRIQRNKEINGKPKFVSDKDGLIILEMGSESKLKEFNMDVNSRIISVNDEDIKCEKDIYSILKKNLYKSVIKIKDCNGIIKEINYVHDNNRIGALLVPLSEKNKEQKIEDKKSIKNFKEVLDEVTNKTTENK